jgi:nitrite reductase/ring-hydroxylating ferredoxin subunit
MSTDDRSAGAPGDGFVRVGSVDDVPEDEPTVVSADGQAVGLVRDAGEIHAVDNRCPHMGFPLSEGSVEDGILTCHWHHARFELSCGDTLDPFADDVLTYPVDVRDGDVYVDPTPERDVPPAEHWRERLEHGLEENLSLVVAKSVIGLDDAGVDLTEAIDTAVSFGTRYREAGWGSGLTTLAVMANIQEDLPRDDRHRALYVGIGEVASDCAGEAPFFVQEPLGVEDPDPERLRRWFRDTIEVRDADGAERVLRSAIGADTPREDIVGTMLAAATDHRYLDSGHRVDFLDKACETLDRLGWDRADEVLPSLVSGLAGANRAEEDSAWRQPVDLVALLEEAFEEVQATVAEDDRGADEISHAQAWDRPDDFVETLLSDDPHEIVDALTAAVYDGASSEVLAHAVADAAARRVAQFGTANEFRDWNTVHHTYSYATAVGGLVARTDDWVGYRAVFDGATSVYLDRFLNMPPTPIPEPEEPDREPDAILEDLGETFEVERDEEVNRAGRLVAEYLDAGGDVDALESTLAGAMLREDVGFHTRQNVEAAFAAVDRRRDADDHTDSGDDTDTARLHLIATARYLAAHTPTRRSGEQTFRIAQRLNRGERIHEA